MHENAMKSILKKTIGVVRHWQIEDEEPVLEIIAPHWESLAKEVAKSKKKWLTKLDVFSIIYLFSVDAINSKKKQSEGDEQLSGVLWDILGDDDAGILSEKITEYFCSIPREYEIYIPLPGIRKEDIGKTINISSNRCIFTKDEEVQKTALDLALGNVWSREPGKIDPSCVYLKQNVRGYCNYRIDTQTVKRALDDFKIIVQLGIIFKVFELNNETSKPEGLLSMAMSHQIDRLYIIVKDITSKEALAPDIEIPKNMCIYLDRLILLKGRGGKVSKEKISEVIQQNLEGPAKILDHTEDEGKNIKSAITWFFESNISENNTFSFIQTCIGLEALLGDEASSPRLTKTLADRCAYLISPNIRDRKAIRKKFTELYEVRSRIIHGQVSELDENSQELVNWGKLVLTRLIYKELIYCLN